MTKTTGSFFTGGALFDIGAIQAGYSPIWGVEKIDKIAAVARLNGFPVITADVIDLDLTKLDRPDHFHASPPCPNFSVANNDKGETALDIAMAEAVCRALGTLKPDTFTLENVPGYRNSVSFRKIVKTLSDLGYWFDVDNLNAADFGVPQTRVRLWVRASRGLLRGYPPPVKWKGWYEAIEDLIDELPDAEFAPWQMARLPEAYKKGMNIEGNVFIGGANKSQSFLDFAIEHRPTIPGIRNGAEPMLTIPADSATNNCGRAFIFSGAGNTNFAEVEPGKGARFEEEPAHTVASDGGGRIPKAFIVPGGNATSFSVREADEPARTIESTNRTGNAPRAFILDGQTNEGERITVREGDEPIFTQSSTGSKRPARAYAGGRVVKMTIKALGRFQTVPDTYIGLTTKINGNGVPCLMAQKILETL